MKPSGRKQTLLFVVGALIAAMIGTAAFAGTSDEAPESQLINIDVKDAPVEQVMRMLAKAANVNIVVGQDVTGTVQAISLRDVTVETALRLIAHSQGFHWYKDENAYIVSKQPPPAMAMPAAAQPAQQPAMTAPAGEATARAPAAVEDDGVMADLSAVGARTQTAAPTVPQPALAAPLSEAATSPRLTTERINLQFADAGMLALMFGGRVADGNMMTGYLGGSRRPSEARRLSRSGGAAAGADVFAGGFGAPTGRRSSLGWEQFGQPGVGVGGQQPGARTGGIGGSGTLDTLLPGDMSPPIAFMPENALLVQGTQEEIDEFREILMMLDVKVKQVEIATKFIEVQTTDDQSLGIDWSISNGSLEFFNQGFAPGEAVNNVVRFARGRFEAQLAALRANGRATVINEPHVITMNNQFAEINFYTTIPYFSAQISYNQFGQREVDFTSDEINVENSLWVIPRINADDSITVYLEPTLEDTVGEVEGPNGERIPIVTTQYVSTTVRVADGETVVLGGLIRKDESMNIRETPLLHRIPVIGKLFRSKRVAKRNSELLIFVTPRIVREAPTQ